MCRITETHARPRAEEDPWTRKAPRIWLSAVVVLGVMSASVPEHRIYGQKEADQDYSAECRRVWISAREVGGDAGARPQERFIAAGQGSLVLQSDEAERA